MKISGEKFGDENYKILERIFLFLSANQRTPFMCPQNSANFLWKVLINPCRLHETLIPRVNSRILLLNETLQKYNLPTIPAFYLKNNKTQE